MNGDDLGILADLAEAEGIRYWAVTDAESLPGEQPDARKARREYTQWIAEKRHGSMDFLARHEPMKYDPAGILPEAKSVIVFALSYFPGRQSRKAPSGGISVYARGRDYHREFGRRIKRIASELTRRYPEDSFRGFTDTAPLQERFYAEKAGLVFTGRNTLSLHRELGSWFFLGEIISTKHFHPTPVQSRNLSHCPGGCTRCIDVCPTAALEGPFRIDASKCISYLTIEHDGLIEPELMERMGTWLFGCDLCQDVCPFNVRAEVTDVAAFANPLVAGEQNLADLLSMRNHEDFTRRFAGTPVMRAGWESMLRNAIIAAANGGHGQLIPAIKELSHSDNPVISATAIWALGHLHSAGDTTIFE
jgi:epoxyqueuosine reductase